MDCNKCNTARKDCPSSQNYPGIVACNEFTNIVSKVKFKDAVSKVTVCNPGLLYLFKKHI